MQSQIFDTLLDPVFIINQHRQIVYCNEAAANLTGSSIRRMIKSQPLIHELFQFQPPIPYLEQVIQINDSTPYFESSFRTTNEMSGQVQVTIQAFATDHWLIYFRDVTLETRLQNKYRQELDGKEKVIVELKQAKVQLEDYAQNLEKMVAARTQEISQLNQMLQALLDSLHQGFFVIDQTGQCLPVYSQACTTTIETIPAHKTIWEVFKYDQSKTEQLKKWLTTVFAEMLPFEDLAPLGPQWYEHSENKKIHLEYFPLRGEIGLIQGIVVVATDLTRLIQAELTAEQQKQKAQFILNFVKNSQSVYQFIKSARDILGQIQQLTTHWQESNKDELFRQLHTLKGGAALFYLYEISQEVHHCEDLLLQRQISEILVIANKLSQQFMEIENELHQQFDRRLENEHGGIFITDEILQQLVKIIPPKHPLLSELEKHLEKDSIAFQLRAYDTLIAQLCCDLNKKSLPLKIMDQQLPFQEKLSPLFQSLIHLFRNYVDHGIETPELRNQQSKPEAAQLEITAQVNDHNELTLIFSDDGAGIQPDKIRQKLKSKQINCDHLNDHEVIQSIFMPEFSTKEQINEISGRGIGLDAIAAEVRDLDGQIEVFSEVNRGTRFVIKIPHYLTEMKNKIAS